jgi:uncharacterized membrane protein YidH (DUF202 family)
MDIEKVGNVPIRPGDFVTPISITVPPPARVVVRRIENADPQSLQPRLNQVRASEIALEPLLLNPGDSFRVELTMLDVHEPVDSSLAVTGRIVGMKDIEFSVRPANGEVQHGLARAYNTEAMIIIPIGTLVVFLALWFWPKLWDWIEHVFGKRPGSTWGRISLNLAVATLVAIALEDIVEGVVEIVRAIIMR